MAGTARPASSSGRLPPAHVGAVHLQVADLARSVEFYEGVLGLRLLARDADSAVLGTEGSARPLVRLDERRGVRPVPRQGRFGLYHFAVLLPDRAALGRFAAHVFGRRERLTGMADHAVSEALYLSDPDGLGIEVYSDRPRASWRFRGDELVMTTEPLDIADVIAAAADRPWTGAPDDTTMGHVHLHVGDLAQAERFYHQGIGFDKTVWSYPGALFLSAGGYHHHLGTNVWSPGPSAAADEARLLDWELVVPDAAAAASVADRLGAQGYAAVRSERGVAASDPWGTRVVIAAANAR